MREEGKKESMDLVPKYIFRNFRGQASQNMILSLEITSIPPKHPMHPRLNSSFKL